MKCKVENPGRIEFDSIRISQDTTTTCKVENLRNGVVVKSITFACEFSRGDTLTLMDFRGVIA